MKKFWSFWITKGKLRDRIILTTLFLIVSFSVIVIGSQLWIKVKLNRSCSYAQQQYHKSECIFALIDQLEDESLSPKDRNEAARLLGYLHDQDALPALKQYDLEIKDDCDLSQELCGTELSKAIFMIESETILLGSIKPFFKLEI